MIKVSSQENLKLVEPRVFYTKIKTIPRGLLDTDDDEAHKTQSLRNLIHNKNVISHKKIFISLGYKYGIGLGVFPKMWPHIYCITPFSMIIAVQGGRALPHPTLLSAHCPSG